MLEQTLSGKQRLEQLIAANDRAVDRDLALAAPTLTTPVEREKARIMRADLATYRATVRTSSRPRARTRRRTPTSGPRGYWIRRPTG
jgi:hypothetical protein